MHFKKSIGVLGFATFLSLAAGVRADSTLTLNLNAANATVTGPFSNTYAGNLGVSIDSNTTLSITDSGDGAPGFATFTTISSPYQLIVGDTAGSFVFTSGGNLAAGSFLLEVTNGPATDKIIVNYGYSPNAISHVGPIGVSSINTYTITTFVSGAIVPALFGGLDISDFGSFANGDLTELKLDLTTTQLVDVDANTRISLTGQVFTASPPDFTPVPLPASAGVGFAMLAGFGGLFAMRKRIVRKSRIV